VSHPSSDIEADNTLRIRALDYCNGRMRRKKERKRERKKERKERERDKERTRERKK
jgi:hypothetical protein